MTSGIVAHEQPSVGDVLKQLVDIEGEGFYHGLGYHASLDNAALARLRTAKKLALASEYTRQGYLEKLRLLRSASARRGCCFCSCQFVSASLDDVEVFGPDLMHRGCRAAFDAEGRAAVQRRAEFDWDRGIA